MKRNSVPINDDFTIVEPAEKSVRKLEEEDPSFEVLELRQKVTKLEKDYQGACRIANEYETQLQEYKSRVESLENLLDSKPIMTSSEEAKGLMRQLDSTRTSLEDSKQANRNLLLQVNMLTRKNEELRRVNQSKIAECEKMSAKMVDLLEATQKNEKLQMEVAKLKCMNKVAKSGRRSVVESDKNETYTAMMNLRKTKKELEAFKLMNQKLQQKVDGFIDDVEKEATNELKEKLRNTTFQLEEECRKNSILLRKNDEQQIAKEDAMTSKMEARKRIIELSMARTKLDKANVVNEELKQYNNELLRRLAESGHAPKVEIRYGAPSSHILKFCPCKAPGTISFDNAVKILESVYFPCDLDWMEKFREAVKDNILVCNLCVEPPVRRLILKGTMILEHFFTRNHSKKVHFQHGTVSLTAFEYWMEKLDGIPKPKPPNGRVMMLH